MTITARTKKLACAAIAATLLAGCSGHKEPTRIEQDIPSGGAALEAWATKAAKDNGVKSDYSASGIARTICGDLIPKHEDLTQVAQKLGAFHGVRAWDTSVLMAIAIYGYCPKYKPLWEGSTTYKTSKVKGVTPIISR
jgi:hypothetical protein